ncbi:Ankyrin repeat domain-containing protein 13 [Dillenia turbinata]|uniref:Ankyrin repeat domain-containing protein 13 n=1 Tax=Dillenia turbinata TaxID=194707 RepID=A0AAN8UKQ6_9MAGN
MSHLQTTSFTAATPPQTLKPDDYIHSPVHYAVIMRDHSRLSKLVSSLPKLADPNRISTETDSLLQEKIADQISSLLDRRDVPFRETPLHLSVRLNDTVSAKLLSAAGADVSLQNAAGWNPLQEALCRRNSEIALILLQQHHKSAWEKWKRRLPRLISVLNRMRDFYMEISFHFESSIVPFVGKVAPSDTYRIWKLNGNLRADTTLSGFDGLKIQRADQSFLFLGDGDDDLDIPCGSLLVLNRDERKIFNAFENAGSAMSESDIAGFCSQTSVYRPGMDVTNAELVGRTNWRRQEKTEMIGEWKAKVYGVHNVLFSFRSRKVVADNDFTGNEQVLPLELDEDSEEGFIVAEYPNFNIPDRRRHSSFVREEREFVPVNRKSVDLAAERRRTAAVTAVSTPQTKEKEYVRSLRPSVWLTEQFPLKTEELLPLLDILANKVKAVRRMRELLTTNLPPGTFPVKVAIPVVPTVRVVITFTKFVGLQPREEFFTPLSSPRHFSQCSSSNGSTEDENDRRRDSYSRSSPLIGSWLRRSNDRSSSLLKEPEQRQLSGSQQSDPFAIPSDYTWTTVDESKTPKMTKPKSTRISKS